MSASLLPPNATPLERALADTLPAGVNPEPIRALWNPDVCPPAFLPFLAWAFSVDGWASALTVDQQRALIRDSVALHRRKGTVWAVKRVFDILNLPATLTEWPTYQGTPYTFRIRIDIADRGADQAALVALSALVDQYKSARSHLDRLEVVLVARWTAYVGAAARMAPRVCVYPATTAPQAALPLCIGAAARIHPRINVSPE
jgi:phage tail P2-like protein